MKGSQFFEQFAAKPPFAKVHPAVGRVFKEYLCDEKVVTWDGKYVINTHFPPYPSRAFDAMASHFGCGGGHARLYSVTFAVTNRCNYGCWHCYNAGRNEIDLPLDAAKRLARELQELGASIVTLTGGEPLLRDDLEEIASAFDDRTSLVLGTTGWGLTSQRAHRLKAGGIFAMGVSLDSTGQQAHDRMRGKDGAFRAALRALELAGEARIYPYVVSVATREFLAPERFHDFVDFARRAGAMEVHLLEPSATGRLAGRTDVLLGESERRLILEYQREMAAREDMPVISSFAHIESPEAFGCGAGITHLYVDGSGEVCPCNLVPLSFGNVAREPLRAILDRMAEHFLEPRTGCVGRVLARHVPGGPLPAPPEKSLEICARCLPPEHDLPKFFRVRKESHESVGVVQLKQAYDSVHGDYDEFWLKEAARPVEELVDRLTLCGDERVFEAGCGTGYGTALLAGKLTRSVCVIAVDLSAGMLAEARKRLSRGGAGNVTFLEGDALELLQNYADLDVIFSSWVLGYIPLEPFFEIAARALEPGGRLAFVVHRENSPREPLEIFGRLVAEDPTVLSRQVAFDFPRDAAQVAGSLSGAGFDASEVWEGAITFGYNTPREVLDHLLKSGAGTAFYDAIVPERRGDLEKRFLEILAERHGGSPPYDVVHEYVSCVAWKKSAGSIRENDRRH